MIRSGLVKLGELGPLRFLQSAFAALFNLILQKIYRFDPWHVSGNYFSRPYKARVVALAEARRPTVVVEIGVGLGDIIGRVHAARRAGLDLDFNVIRAARHCVPKAVVLAQANFLLPETVIEALKAQHIEAIDCLILVNWIHMIGIAEIAATLDRVASFIPVRYVLVDAIKSGTPGYRHHHDAGDFKRLGQIEEITEGDGVRDLVLIRRP